MLVEFVITPDVFEATSYESNALCLTSLEHLAAPLMEESLIRDLRDGEWSRFLREHDDRLHPAARRLFKELRKANRFSSDTARLNEPPADSRSWCPEALASHAALPLHGVITTAEGRERNRGNAIVASIERLGSTSWWQDRASSVTLDRTIDSLIRTLRPLLAHSNRLVFVDSHLDPTSYNYREFVRIVDAIRQGAPPPQIEFHRPVGDVPHGEDIGRYWRERFGPLHDRLEQRGLSATVYIWDQFHDRYLISDLAVIQLGWGFDTSQNPNHTTTWNRLSRSARVAVEREFEANSPKHKLQGGPFRIGRGSATSL